jgi:hypothetical protein
MIAYAVIRKKNGQWKIRPVRSTGIDEDGRPRLAGPVVLRPKVFRLAREAKAYIAEQETA